MTIAGSISDDGLSVRETRPGFLLLIWVEVRKLLDTRASRAVLYAVAGLSLAISGGIVWMHLAKGTSLGFSDLSGPLGLFTSIAMPIIGILGMTGDWVHRTASTYYPMVGSRTKIYFAKVVAALTLATVLLLVNLLISVAASLVVSVSQGSGISPFGSANAVWTVAVLTYLGTIFGVAVAALARSVPVALVVCLVSTMLLNLALPLLWPDVGPYLVSLSVVNTVISGATDTSPVGPAVSSFLLWYVLPLALGWWRNERSDL